MEIKKSRVNLLDLKFFQKYVSFEEACKILLLVYATWSPKMLLNKEVKAIQYWLARAEKSRYLTASKMIAIHQMIEQDDNEANKIYERANSGYITRLYRVFWRKPK